MKKPRKTAAKVLREHLGVEVNDDGGFKEIFESFVDSFPLTYAKAAEADRKAAKDFLQAVDLLDSAIQRLPHEMRLTVGHQLGSMLGLTNGRGATGEETERALHRVLIALRHSMAYVAILAKTKPLGQPNWRAIGAVHLCRGFWRDAKGEEPPCKTADPRDAASPHPFMLFVADMFTALGVGSRVDTALRAWRQRFESIEPNGLHLRNR